MPKSFSILALLAASLTACAAEQPVDVCPGLPEPAGDVVTTTLPLSLFAGAEPLALGDVAIAESGAGYRVEKLKMYVSEVELLSEGGGHEHALLVDEGGEAHPHGVALLDGEAGALALSLQAPRGSYEGLRFTVGVPATCPDGETTLNHSDASAMPPPLDVDSDMYWSWDPGYTHFKIEGRVSMDGGEEPFFYHVGEDERLMHVTLEGPLAIDEGESSSTIAFDVNRLFVTPEGAHAPKLDGDDDDRKVHSGPLSDQVKANFEGSGVLSIR